MFTKDQVLYGLRNLTVGDEEETRIMDQLDDVDDPRIAELEETGKFNEAYELAIQETMTTEELQVVPIECLCWSLWFELLPDEDVARFDGSVQILKDLLGRVDLTDDESLEMTQYAINQGFDMWALYQRISTT